MRAPLQLSAHVRARFSVIGAVRPISIQESVARSLAPGGRRLLGSAMVTTICTVAGAALLLLVAYDIYSTILHATARYGPIGERINRLVWKGALAVAFKCQRHRRHRFLNTVGPVLLPLLIFVYILLLITAFALIYYPRIEGQFIINYDRSEPDWIEAIYFSGVTLSTLGYGDVVARTPQMRLLAMAEGGSGFALISLSITYLLTVYSALERKRAMSLSLYHQAGEGADASALIIYHSVDGRFYGLRESLRAATRDIQSVLESHVEHPVIHYFHPLEVYKSLPRILFLLLESSAVIRSALDTKEYAELRNFPEVRTLEASAQHVLVQLVTSLDLERRTRLRERSPEECEEDERRWRRRFEQHMAKLSRAGVKTREEVEEGWREYRERRELWEDKLRRLTQYLGYDWQEVTGDGDLDYAADEEMEKPLEAIR